MGLIDADYNDTINKSKRIVEISDEILREISAELQLCRESLVIGWKGDSSACFAKKYIKEVNEIQVVAKEIKVIGEKLGTNAKMLKAAEELGKMLWNKI